MREGLFQVLDGLKYVRGCMRPRNTLQDPSHGLLPVLFLLHSVMHTLFFPSPVFSAVPPFNWTPKKGMKKREGRNSKKRIKMGGVER